MGVFGISSPGDKVHEEGKGQKSKKNEELKEKKEQLYCETNVFWIVSFIRVLMQHQIRNIQIGRV